MTGGARAGFGEGSGESGWAEAPGPRPRLRSCLAASASGPSLRRRHPLWVTHCTLVLCSSVVAISQVVPASCEPQGAAARSGVTSGHREAVTPPRAPQRGAPARHPCVVLDADRWGARYSGSLGPGAACPPRPALGPALARSSWSPLPCSYRSLSKDTGGGDPEAVTHGYPPPAVSAWPALPVSCASPAAPRPWSSLETPSAARAAWWPSAVGVTGGRGLSVTGLGLHVVSTLSPLRQGSLLPHVAEGEVGRAPGHDRREVPAAAAAPGPCPQKPAGGQHVPAQVQTDPGQDRAGFLGGALG